MALQDFVSFYANRQLNKIIRIIIRHFVIIFLPVKHPLLLRALEFKTGSMALSEHGENLLLFFLSPDVARANMI